MRIIQKFLLILTFLIILSAGAYANSYYDQWGFGNHRETGTSINNVSNKFYSGVVWGSNFQSQTNDSVYTKTISSITSNVTPLAIDLNGDGLLEFVTAQGNTVRVINNQGEQLGSYTLSYSVCGQMSSLPKYTYLTNDPNTIQFFVMTNHSGNHYYIYGFNYTSENGLILDSTSSEISVSKINTCNLMGGLSFLGHYSTDYSWIQRYIGGTIYRIVNIFTGVEPYIVGTQEINSSYYIVSPYQDNTMMLYNAVTNTVSGNVNTPPYTTRALEYQGTLKGGMTCGQAELTGIKTNICAWISKDSGSKIPNITVWNMFTDTYTSKALKTAGTYDYSTVVLGNVGDPSGDPEFIVTLGTGVRTIAYIQVYDMGLNLLKEIAGSSWSMPAVADFNHDGNNELCVCEDNRFYAYTSVGYNSTWQGNFSGSRCGEYFTVAELINNNSYSEIVTYDGIYQYEGFFQTMTNLYNMGIPSTEYGQYLPVSTLNRVKFQTDIVFISQTEMIYYTASAGVTSVCGNGICENSETIFNCESDCYFNPFGNVTSAKNNTIGYLPPNSQCLNDSWCASGRCNNQMCVGKNAGESCTTNDECASRTCSVNKICTPTDMVDNVKNIVEFAGFRSTASKMLLSFIIIIAGATIGAILLMGFGAMGSAIGGFLGLFFGMSVSIFVFGWLAVFFIVLSVLLIVALVIIIAMTTRGIFGGG